MRAVGMSDSVPSLTRAVREALTCEGPFTNGRTDARRSSHRARRRMMDCKTLQCITRRLGTMNAHQKPLSADVAIDGTLMPWLDANCTAALNVDASDCNCPGADCAIYD